MGNCAQALAEHSALGLRRKKSEEQLETAAKAFAASTTLDQLPISVFCAGSVARGEVGSKSDMDVFVTADETFGRPSRLREFTLFAEVIEINRRLGLPEFSNDGQYLKVYSLDQLRMLTGSRQDDSENLFTARMLLILESQPILHANRYEQHLRAVLEHYYRDSAGKKSFRPLFLLNDVLRYWRTLCLNYEETRHDKQRAWRKKNVNLKFSRMVTVFGTVLPLVMRPIADTDALFALCRMSPLQRLATAVDELSDKAIELDWLRVLNVYEEFLKWKEEDNPERFLEDGEHKEAIRANAQLVSTFLFRALTHHRIPEEYRRYLLI